jgi:hypothetical protein
MRPFESLPDRPISEHQNLVTAEGLQLIKATLARLRQERALAQSANNRPRHGGLCTNSHRGQSGGAWANASLTRGDHVCGLFKNYYVENRTND